MKKTICLNKSTLDFMASKITPESLVIEFGGGWSSRWFADRCGRLVVIETNVRWARLIYNDLQFTRAATSVLIPPVKKLPVRADLVLIDCSEVLRFKYTQWGWPLVKPGGWILFDDAQRPQNGEAVTWLIEQAGKPITLVWQPGDVKSAKPRTTMAWQKNNSK